MSRIGKKEIVIPAKTEIVVTDGAVSVKGPLGQLDRVFPTKIKVVVADGKVSFVPSGKSLDVETNSLWGTVASHVNNMIIGVNQAFQKKLIVEGIGFKADMVGTDLVFKLGFSHPIKVAIPKELKVAVEKNVVTVSGIDKELVGRYVAEIRALKKPEPYKGKGIRYDTEVIRRKEGKKTA